MLIYQERKDDMHQLQAIPIHVTILLADLVISHEKENFKHEKCWTQSISHIPQKIFATDSWQVGRLVVM